MKWHAVKQQNMKPNPNSVMPDEVEGRGVGGGWDDNGEGKKPKGDDSGGGGDREEGRRQGRRHASADRLRTDAPRMSEASQGIQFDEPPIFERGAPGRSRRSACPSSTCRQSTSGHALGALGAAQPRRACPR